MFTAKIVSWAELPASLKSLQANKAAKYFVIMHGDDVLDYYSDEGWVNKLPEFSEILEWVEKAYRLGAGNHETIPTNVLAYVAHTMGERARQSAIRVDSPLQKKGLLREAEQFDECSRRFAIGQTVIAIYHPVKSDIISYKVVGSSGATYSVNPSGNGCSCAAGIKSKSFCRHMRMVECYIQASKEAK